MPIADIGTGTTLKLGGTEFQARITSISNDSKRETVNVSGMDSTVWHSFISQKLRDPGEISVEGYWDPAAGNPVISAKAALVVTFPDGTEWGCDGAGDQDGAFCTAFEFTTARDEAMTFSVTFKLSGPVRYS